MKLVPLGMQQVADDPDPGDRKAIHFGTTFRDTLYTIRKDDTLRVWALDAELVPTPVATTRTTAAWPFFAPYAHADGDRLVLANDGKLVVIDASEPRAPKTICAITNRDIQGAVVFGGRLYTQMRYEGGRYTYGSCALPTEDTKAIALDDETPTDERSPAYLAVVHREHVYWISQDAICVRTLAPSTPVASLRLDCVVSQPIVVGEHRLAVMEVYDDERNGLVFVDVASPRPKKLAVLYKKHRVRGFQLVGRELYLCVQKSGAKAVTSIAVVDVATMTELASVPLPGVERRGEATWPRWIGANGERVAVLQGNGTLTRFAVER